MTSESGFRPGAPRAAKKTPGPPRTRRGEATRGALLAAAETLFGRDGYHGTGVTDITREAGVAQGTFYLYFPGKEEIFRELVRDLSRRLRRTIREATAGLDDRLAVEEAGLRAFLAFAAAHRDLYRIVFEARSVDPTLFRWYYERIAAGYTAGLGRAMDAGQLPPLHAETLAYCLMGAAHFLGMRWVVWEEREPPEEAMRTVLAFIRAGLTAAAVPPAATTRPAAATGTAGEGA
jgi:AcrR family transcriptional regulator